MTWFTKPWGRYAIVWVAAAIVAAPLTSGVRSSIFVAIGFSGAIASVVGARVNRPTHPSPWYLVATAMALYTTADAIVLLAPPAPGATAYAVVDALHLLAYPFGIAALLVLSRIRTAERRPFELLDTGILGLATGLVFWVFLVEPAWRSAADFDQSLSVALAFPVGSVIAFIALLRLAQTQGPGRAATHAVATMFGLLLVYESVIVTASGIGLMYPDPYAVNPEWFLVLAVAGTLMLHPSMVRFARPVPQGRVSTRISQILGLAFALVVPSFLVAGQLLVGAPLSLLSFVVSSVALVLLASTRMLLLVREVHELATTDELTGLPNRRFMYSLANSRLADKDVPRALLLLDLDRFKDVNDALGHQAGDNLLIQVAARLQSQVRGSDLLARLGGDEFAILLEDVGEDLARQRASAVVDALAAPFSLDGLDVHSGASVGIALFPEQAAELSTLLRRADIAMYRAKSAGGHGSSGAGYESDESARLRLSEDFHSALANHELVLYHQPKVELKTGAVCSAESLIRWQHPVRGLLEPAEFLGCVEDAGLMSALTKEALTLALDQAAAWWARNLQIPVAVNLSASSLTDNDLARRVTQMVADRGLPTSALRLEITEDFIMADTVQARTVLNDLRFAGLATSIDDFGTGYSSLAYLRDLPIDELKLDRSFVTPMLGDPRAQALVSSTICLAHSLGLSMVAEGIEDGATYAMLTKLDCDEGQGYYMSKPLPAHEFEAWLSTRQVRRVPSVSGVPTQVGASMALRNKSVEAGETSGPSRPAAT